MSDTATKYTERDVVLRERAAFKAGVAELAGPYEKAATDARSRGLPQPAVGFTWWPCRAQDDDVAARYPLPKVTRPRVVEEEGGVTFRSVNGTIQGRKEGPHWHHVGCWQITPERIRLWADLLANPTEEVDAE